MRVLLVSHSSVNPSYQKRLGQVAKQGTIRLTMVAPKRYAEGEIIESRQISDDYSLVRLHAFFAKTGRQHLHFYSPISLYRVLKRTNPEIIHLDEEPQSFVSFLTIFWSRVFANNRSKIILYSAANIFKTHKEWGILNPRRYLYPFWEKYCLRRGNAILACNYDAINIFRNKGFRGRIYYMPLTVDENMFVFNKGARARLRKELGLSEFTIGFVGKVEIRKGLATLFKAATYITGEYTVLIIGEGPDKQHLSDLSKKLGIEKNILWLGFVNAAELPDYYSCMDVLVVPSETTTEWKEQFGRVIIEAMACEVPVIGSSSGEIPNVVGDVGLIFEEGNDADLADKIADLMANKRLRTRLGKAGRERIMQGYTNESFANKLRDIYYDVL